MPKITYNTKLIFNSTEDEQKILKMLEASRFCWNECSKVKFHEVHKNSITDLHNRFYRNFRDSQAKIPAQIVIAAEQSVLSTYRSIKSNKHKINKPCFKKKLSIRLDKRSYSYKNQIFSIISLEKRIKCYPYIYPKLQELVSKYNFCDPLLFVRNNEVMISLTFNLPDYAVNNKLTLGVDLGVRVPVATSEGNIYIDKKFNASKRRLRYLKRCLQSKGTQSSKKHLKKLRRKERNKNKDFIHKLTKKIIKDTKADTLVIENLKSIKVKKNKYKNQNRLSQIPLAELRSVLTYKALLNEKTVIEVCPSYTSQIDSQTGKKDGIRRGRRYYSISGKVYDADVNAAINIASRSELPVSLSPQGVGTYGQVVVNQPIVGSPCTYKLPDLSGRS